MKTKTIFSCQSCGYQSPKWLGRCPDCNSWNSFAEEDYTAPSARENERASLYKDEPVLLKDVEAKEVVAAIIPVSTGDSAMKDGLLGMSFLKYFNFTVDRKNNKLILDKLNR